jgi:monovalent cation/hydrogen antiporter
MPLPLAELSSGTELVVLGVLVAVSALFVVAEFTDIPYPILFVLGGLTLGFVPGVPDVALEPELVLVVFLPPLLYGAAFFANLGDMRANLRGLTLSSVGLVLVTMVVVAVVAHALVPGLPWAAAFAFGTVVSPTDPLAGALIMRRIGVPRLLVSAAEGEGLFNDATALVAYKVAVAAVLSGSFSLGSASLRFLASAAGGVAIGLAVGWIVALIRARVQDVQVSVTISLLSGYAAFIPAAELGASGALAAVTTGLFMGFRGPSIIPPRIRLQGFMVWEMFDFLLNASLFVLVGLQLHHSVTEARVGRSAGDLAVYALAASGVVAAVRVVWFFTVPYLIRALDRRPSQRLRRVGARSRFVLAWSGMRGAVSLAAALALPLKTHAGAPFPDRELIIFLTFAVIFATLVVQGLSLPGLIHRLRVTRDGSEDDEELHARLAATKAALAQIDELAAEEWTRDDTVERMRGAYEYRKRRLAARAGKIEDDGYEDRSLAYQQMLQMVLVAQREALVRLRNEGTISNEVMNRVVRELDLEESRLEI